MINDKIDKAYIFAITDENYITPLTVAVDSIKRTKTVIPIYVMVPSSMQDAVVDKIEKLGVKTIKRDYIDIGDNNSSNNKLKYWNNTFFKLQIMSLTQFGKLVYVDADMIVMNNIDELFDYPGLSATTGGKSAHPEYMEFNSGIMVIEPNDTDYKGLLSCIDSAISRKQAQGKGYGDQDVFNEYYADWKNQTDHNIGEKYNAVCTGLDAFIRKARLSGINDVKVLHYSGEEKIWNITMSRHYRLMLRYMKEGRKYLIKANSLYRKRMKELGL